MINRFEHFKDYQKNKAYQEKMIVERKKVFNEACKNDLNDDIKQHLYSDVIRAENVLNQLILDEMEERRILEGILETYIQDFRIRDILFMKYIQNITLKECAKVIGFSYDYTRELCSKGRMILKQVMM